jgi:hypothetical protein
MSLKAVHVVVILSSILLCLGFGVYELLAWKRSMLLIDLALSVLGLGGGVLLIVYFKTMLRKLRNISYL